MISRTTVLSAAALLALSACTDASQPTGPTPGSGPLLDVFTAEQGLLRAADARVNQSEPSQWDRTRFNIQLAFAVEPTERQREVFEVAAARWERVIIGDVPSISGTLPDCTAGRPPVTTTGVDDIVIQVELVPIDGPGRILGSAGPCFVRNGDNLPVSGRMRFDVADLGTLEARGLFDEVIVHEMGHVLGIGTLWNFRRALRVGASTSPTVYFAGKYANTHWGAEGGDGLLPVENTGGAGTAGGHWRESVLRNELMTGFLNLGANPLSRISASSLRDLGYRTSIVGEQYALVRGTDGIFLPSAASIAAAVGGATISDEGVHIEHGEELLSVVGYVPGPNDP